MSIMLDISPLALYFNLMIKSFRCPETEKLYNRKVTKRIPPDIQKVAIRKLWVLDAADSLVDLTRPPGNKLESLAGDRFGQYSIRINNQYRICFTWQVNDAHHVEIVDYH